MPYRRYADFSGRSRRKEYWMFQLLFWLVILAITFLFGVVDSTNSTNSAAEFITGIGGVFVALFFLGSLIPMIAVTVRRLHDQNKSGWYYLLGLIPYIGGLIMLFFMCTRGTDGANQYGPDPFDPDFDASVFA